MRHWAYNLEEAAQPVVEPTLPAEEQKRLFTYLDDSLRDREFWPLDAPHMPVPGLDFLILADSAGDFENHDWFMDGPAKRKRKAELDALGQKVPRRSSNQVRGTREQKRLINPGPFLDRLYRRATYTRWCMSIHDRVGQAQRIHTVPGHIWSSSEHGPKPAKVMIIGKWPGHTEMETGRNLVGASGDKLREALLQAGVPQTEFDFWYVTNLIKHHDFPDAKKDKVPIRWANNWRVVLEQELRIVKPDFILLLGTDAVQHTLLDQDLGGVTSIQGRSLPWKICLSRDKTLPEDQLEWHHCLVMACRHPAHVLREPIYEDEFRGTIRRFKEMLDGRVFGPDTMAVDHRVVDNEEDLALIVDGCLERGENEVALDCEWEGSYPGEPGAWLRTVQFSTRTGFAVCVNLRQGGYHPDPVLQTTDEQGKIKITKIEQHTHPDFGKVTFRGGIEGAVRQLSRLLVATPERKVRIIGHSLRSDLPWLALGFDRILGEHLINQFQGAATPELTSTEGGFDTTLAMHAVYESPGDMGYKLEPQALTHCGVPRYDDDVLKWKTRHCAANKIKKDNLRGFGHCPNEILFPYSCWDVDATFRLYEAFNGAGGEPGQLDADSFGQDCRKPFWLSMRASPACLEMEMNGITVDRARVYILLRTYKTALKTLESELRAMVEWKGFNAQSSPQCCALLFGSQYGGKDYPNRKRSLYLEPVATSTKPKKPWAKALLERENNPQAAAPLKPSTDKETLGILRARLYQQLQQTPDDPQVKLAFETVDHLRNIRFVSQILKAVLTSHDIDWDFKKGTGSGLAKRDEHGNLVYRKGLLKWQQHDGKVRTHIQQTKETGRYSTVRPPLQNLGKRREKNLKDCLGELYTHPIRTVLRCTPWEDPADAWVFVEADYIGAELATMAIQSGDPKMIDHCMRSNLPETDPNYYDIHSNRAVEAFQLKVNDYLDPKSGKRAYEVLNLPIGAPCPATKTALQAIGRGNLRDVAKTIVFGIPYGRGDEAVLRAVEEEGTLITLEEARIIRESILGTYSRLGPYLDRARGRVFHPGYIVSCHGRRRRFYVSGRDDGKAEREAGNFGIQGGVADHVSIALDHLYNYRCRWHNGTDQLAYRMVLQMHDAVLFEVRPRYVEWFVEEVLPECMTKRVEMWQCDFEGRVIGQQPFHLGVDSGVYKAWGEKFSVEEGATIGLPARFCAKPRK